MLEDLNLDNTEDKDHPDELTEYEWAEYCSTKAAEVSSKGKSIYAYEAGSKVAQAYSAFTKEVLTDAKKKDRLRSSDAR